jgi:hypothetical protein
LAAELIVVVLGVLIAISIDAWRQGLQDRRDEKALLESLLAEFDFNRDALAAQAAVYRRGGDSSEELLRLGPEARSLPSDTLAGLWRWITRGGTDDPSSGALDAATASGEIGLVQDAALRAALAQWSADVKNLRNVEHRIANLIFEQFMPWRREATILPPDGFGESGWPTGRSEPDLVFLSSSPVLENFLREEVAWARILDGIERELGI